MNESETRAELIDPKLRENGWDTKLNSEVKVHREFRITEGKILGSGVRSKPIIADYVLAYKNRKLAVVEAKSSAQEVGEGVAQAKDYALKLKLDHAYAANGREIYYMDLDTPSESTVKDFFTPDELYTKAFPKQNTWQDNFDAIPYEEKGGKRPPRFYQEIAVQRALDAIANRQQRILLTLATGTGKTNIAFQIAWKLFEARWNVKFDGSRRPRILFLADRNILANQAFNDFNAFPEDALVRINPKEIKKNGRVPQNGSLFFTIFQTFMSGPNDTPYFGQYEPDYFDFIIIDECHRGGANDESTWRSILEYFSPAYQIGLTATPKRNNNVDTYKYFGEPVFVYSLKEGINDGFLTPFKVKKITSTLDEYTYSEEDDVIEGELEKGKTYTEGDFNKKIVINEREAYRVNLFMNEINPKEKTIVFCANQSHAAMVRDLINQSGKSTDPLYCVRVTADDGEKGEEYLRDFQDNEKSIPTILTTSQKLSTGVDARNVRNIVLLRKVNNIIEFKQIVGRGTRLYDGKYYFTIYDFVNASERFKDAEWDGEPEEYYGGQASQKKTKPDSSEPREEIEKKKKLRIKLGNGKEFDIHHRVDTLFMGPDGQPMSVQEFLNSLFGTIPQFFTNEEELRKIWSNPLTRKTLLRQLEENGFGREQLLDLQKVIDAEKSDIFDVLEFVSFSVTPITRSMRVEHARDKIFPLLNGKQKEFIEFVLSKYVQDGVEELDDEKLPDLLELKYQSLSDAQEHLGATADIRNLFIQFQKHLYREKAAS